MDRKDKFFFVFIFGYLGFIADGSLTEMPSLKRKISNVGTAIQVFLYIPLGYLLGLLKMFSGYFKSSYTFSHEVILGVQTSWGSLRFFIKHGNVNFEDRDAYY